MEKIIIKVGYNETLSSIARQYKLTTKILSLANNNINNVEEGDYIIIPYRAKAVHIVRPLETLSDIAKKYNVEIEKLKKDNNIKAPLYIGQQIVVSENNE